MKKIITAILLIAVLISADLCLTYSRLIADSDYFVKNDFEITQCKHPEKVWDKVFFGNSVVISAYIEEESKSGYINLGLDYGTVTDLKSMIEKKHIKIGSELVIGLNYLTLYDEFETNPTYIWHKKPYQPYVYFQRDRFYPLITGSFERLLNDGAKNALPYKYLPQQKSVYHGRVADTAMREKLAEYETEFFNLPIEKFEKNISALEDVVKYCEENDILVRAVWMPWNTAYEMPHLLSMVRTEADKVFAKYDVDVKDMETECLPEWFYDSGHLNYDVGAPKFTAELDKWL